MEIIMKRNIQLLNGWWDYRIGDGEFTKKRVPYSDFATGFAECRLNFDKAVSTEGKRAFLVFDGITYAADVTFNGKALGTMLPYSEYRYEITDLIGERDNLLDVIVRDTEVVFGPAEGWENYSGITRDVYIEYTEADILDTVFWHAELSDDLKAADCTLEIKTDGTAKNYAVEVTLTEPTGRVAFSDTLPLPADGCVKFPCEYPSLWSPDTPTLYSLSVTLVADGKACDTYATRVGFKKLVAGKKRFYLNGEPFFFIGVCRHDIFGDQGHVMTEEQMYMDMRMIKDTGANYVRLVHYPHHKKILEIADELGLFVSEEPGLWFNDVKNEEIFNSSLEVLRRVVVRDRNHVSVAFWLSFNECIFTPEYLTAAAKVCRENDPYRMVSGANCMDEKMTKEHFAACDLDFYSMHPYTWDTYRFVQLAQYLDDKPLFFTEWGGYHVYDNVNYLKSSIDRIAELWHNPDNGPVLAGAAIWCWAGVYEFNRAAPACYHGVLCEGLVDNYRRPNLGLAVFTKYFKKIKTPKAINKYLHKSEFEADGNYAPVSLDGIANTEAQSAAWCEMMAESAKPIPRFYYDARKLRVMKNGPTLPEKVMSLGALPVDLLQKPIVININAPFELEIGKAVDGLCLIGNVSMPCGFPIGGKFGELAATLTLSYADGSQVDIPLRNGQEITTAAGWYGPSRINPVASGAPRALKIINDMDREHYVANLFRVDANSNVALNKITVSTAADTYQLLLYGVTVKEK
ncbi:MAG: hypothetical protein E7589_00080 [Ruminococcaceae bacterium]|nr:hypothetical protein [Oscillospiraceae bacterium]